MFGGYDSYFYNRGNMYRNTEDRLRNERNNERKRREELEKN